MTPQLANPDFFSIISSIGLLNSIDFAIAINKEYRVGASRIAKVRS